MNRYLIDPTIDQIRPDIDNEEIPLLVAEVSPEFLAGDKSYHLTWKKGFVRYRAYPSKGGFKNSHAYRKYSWMPLAENILNRLLIFFARQEFGLGPAIVA